MKVMFHSICDRCKKHGSEYGAMFPECDECGKDICEDCAAEWHEEDGRVSKAVCHECAKETA